MTIVDNEDDYGDDHHDGRDHNNHRDDEDGGGDGNFSNDDGDDDDCCGGARDSEVGDAHRCLCGRLPSLQPSSDVVASLNQNLLSPHHL